MWVVKSQSVSNYCEHCRRAISRRGTFLIQNEAGEQKQVGSKCLKYFLDRKNVRAIQAAEQVKAEQARAQVDADESRHHEIISNPYEALAHAMCHLFKDRKNWDAMVYLDAILTLRVAQDSNLNKKDKL